MSFRTDWVTAVRFYTDARPPTFDQEHIDKLAERRIGQHRIASEDGVEVAWAAGTNVLDAEFGLEKNIINDSLHFDLRITKDVLPADLMKAYYDAEVQAMAKFHQVGSARRRQCKIMARERLEDEAKDGRFAKHRLIPCMWDRATGHVWFGMQSLSHADRFTSLFERTFEIQLALDGAGDRCPAINRDGVSPAQFIPGSKPDYYWIGDESNVCWLGNEFLHWLWYYSDVESDTIELSDKSELTFMFQKNLVVDCPRGQTGVDQFKTVGTTRLPEARRAIQAGKIPRKCAFVMVRHDTQYEFSFNAETFAIGTAKLIVEEDVTDHRARLERRIELWRELNIGIDLLYEKFLSIRTSPKWESVLGGMQKWLQQGDKR